MVADGFLDPREIQWVDRRMLVPFLLSGLLSRMAKAAAHGRYWQEASFTMATTAGRLYGIRDGEAALDQVVVQGIIDAYFWDGDRLVLVDYKSDRIKLGQEGDLLRRYGGQLRIYAEGLEAFTGKQVSEMIIYSLALGKEIIVP
jgi:ATP-dependent helicase/nuclease subunit A